MTSSPWRARLSTAVPYLVLGLVVLVLSAPSLRYAGAAMDEGLLLVYPELILKGWVPNRDFLAIYGPGTFWILAAVYALFGVSVDVERVVGLSYHILIVLLIYAIVRRWAPLLGLGSSVIAAIILMPLGLAAYAWLGAMALFLTSLLLVSRDRPGRLRSAAAGFAAAAALLFRPDLAPALALAAIPLALTTPARRAYLAGAALGVAPLVLHSVVAGPLNVLENIAFGPLKWGSGRQLPLPGPEPLLLGLVFISVGVALVAGARPRGPVVGQQRRRVLLALGLFSVGTLHQALQRADLFHLIWAGAVPIACLPLTLTESLAGGSKLRRPYLLAAVLIASLALSAAAPQVVARAMLVEIPRAVGLFNDYQVWAVQHGQRPWYPLARDRDVSITPVGSAEASNDLAAAVVEVERRAGPGSRLFVGPRDLRRTNYNDTVIYHLLPRLVPASYYLQMDPGSANATDSRLAADIATADVLLLSSRYENWNEPNASMLYGSDAPNEVVRSLFAPVAQHGSYFIYVRRTSPER